ASQRLRILVEAHSSLSTRHAKKPSVSALKVAVATSPGSSDDKCSAKAFQKLGPRFSTSWCHSPDSTRLYRRVCSSLHSSELASLSTLSSCAKRHLRHCSPTRTAARSVAARGLPSATWVGMKSLRWESQ